MNFASSDYKLLFGTHKCDCGKEHTFGPKCLLSRGAIKSAASFISDFTPPLSRIVLMYSTGSESLMQDFFAALKRDFRAAKVMVDSDKKRTELISLPEDSKLVVAIGSDAVDSAKYKAYTLDLPVVVVALPTSRCLSSHCIMDDDGMKLSFEVNAPVGYIYDIDFVRGDEKAALFGEVAAYLNTAFEYYSTALLNGAEYCPFIAGAMTDIAAKTILSVAEMDKNAPNLPDVLIEAALKLAIIAPDLRGGEAQCSVMYDMLGENEFSQGRLRFVFAAVLSQLYRSHVMRRRSFTPPPDNNYRLEHISELLGVSEQRAIKGMLPQMSGREAALIEYKIKEYTADLLEKLNRNISLFKPAFKTFKRLHGDDGYSLGEFVSEDISLCIALAPDIVHGSGMLTTLKRLGELEAYIV